MSDDETTLSNFMLGGPLDVQQAYARLLADRVRVKAALWEGQKYRAELAGRACRLETEQERLWAVVDGLRGYLSIADVEDEESGMLTDLRSLLTEFDKGATGEGT